MTKAEEKARHMIECGGILVGTSAYYGFDIKRDIDIVICMKDLSTHDTQYYKDETKWLNTVELDKIKSTYISRDESYIQECFYEQTFKTRFQRVNKIK